MTTVARLTNPQIAQSAAQPKGHRFVIFVLAFFAGWPAFKRANIQYLEMFMLVHLMFLLFCFASRGFQVRIVGLWRKPGYEFGAIMLAVLTLSVSSLRLQRYEPMYGPYFLHYPLLVVVMRYVELFVVVFYGLYAAELMRRDPALRDYGLRTYLNSALITVGMTMFGTVLFHLTKLQFSVNGEGRGSGAFPEGGPWGLYLLTAAMVLRILWARRAISQPTMVVAVAMLGWGFYSCQSKACMFAAFMVFVTQIFFQHNLKQKLISAAAILVVCGATWWIFDVPGIWQGLKGMQSKAEILALLNQSDANVAYGRIAGTVVVPRMIAAHPWTGIGMGNYPVMRNDPAYLGRMMPVHNYDLPGLGLLWVAAELGIPALIALYGMMLYPAFLVYKRNGNGVLLGLALCQPYVHLLGAQITVFYPWLASAFVLSFLPLADSRASSRARPARVRPQMPQQRGLLPATNAVRSTQ